ncbi:Transcription initiation factor TFIID subunit 5 [Sorochytrium milnesiophthora]
MDGQASTYLQTRGYRPRDDSAVSTPITATDSQVHKYIPDYNPEAFTPEAYESSYGRLRRWLEDSLDVFKMELRQVLFPVFVHAYLDNIEKGLLKDAQRFFDTYKGDHQELYSQDLQSLASVTMPSHIQENELASTYRSTKYIAKMTSTTFQLLISFLEDAGCVSILKIISTHLNIQVTASKSKKRRADEIGLIGNRMSNNLDVFNSSRIALGHVALDPSYRIELERHLKLEDEKQAQTGEDTPSLLELFKNYRPDPPVDAPVKSVPFPPPKAREIEETTKLMYDMSKLVSLSPTALPSACLYTIHNAYDTLTCASISDDVTMMAGGFSDSVVRVWSLTGDKLRAVKPNVQTEDQDSVIADLEPYREDEGSYCKKLVGHSGSVYSTSFSYDNRYLLSCSKDRTVRLWSMDTYTNLVCYRGHNYPVWDVDFGPEGFYFATASHDRTARLWSCDHIYPLRIFAGHLSDVDAVKFHPNSNYIVTGSSDKTARLWDVQRGACVRVFTGHSAAVQCLAFSPDGKKLATAGEDKNIYLWDLAMGTRIKKMTGGHKAAIYSLSFSREGTLLASGGADNSVRIWDVLKSGDEDGGVAGAGGGSAMAPNGLADGGAGKKRKKRAQIIDAIETFYTKKTPVVHVQFTRRNLLLGVGAFCPELP